MTHIFDRTILREYDIRGTVGKTLNEEDAYALGRTFASLASDEGARTLAVGRDGRTHSPELEAELNIPLANKDGADQTITFDAPDKVTYGTKSLALKATSSSGMPVSYYVREGPAYVEGNTLRFVPLPPRAKFPVKVTVVAWQYGRSIEPKVKSAEPVERTFLITK